MRLFSFNLSKPVRGARKQFSKCQYFEKIHAEESRRRRSQMRKISRTCLIAALCSGFVLAQRQPGPEADKRHKQENASTQNNEEQNKQIVRHVFDDLWSRGRYELIDRLYSPNCIVHSPGLKGNSLNEAVEEGKSFRTAAPDAKLTANKIQAHGDIVTVEWTATGKNTGRDGGLPATGKSVHIRGNSTFKLADGKIIEVTNNYDQNELFRQLGVNPRK
jgi:steroid delta-isomerase-like uncharacterized protein